MIKIGNKVEFSKNRFQGNLILLAETLHRWFFGQEMSDVMKEFLKNLSFSFFGGIVAATIMFGVSIIAGRILGPLGFGTYNYLLSLATTSMIFFLLGSNTGAIRFLSDEKYEERRGAFMSATLAIIAIQGIIFFCIVLLTSNYLQAQLNLNPLLFSLVFIFSAVFAFKEITDSFLRSFLLIKKQAIFRVVDALCVFGTLVFFLLMNDSFSPVDYAYSVIFGAFIFITLSIFHLRKQLSFFSFIEIKQLLGYNKYLLLVALSGIILSFDKVIIGKTIGTEALGVFSAYYASSQLIISNLGLVFMNVFWPFVIKNKNNIPAILGKLDVLLLKFLPIGIILNSVSVTFFVSLYGEEYPLHLILIILFAIASIANIVFFVYTSLLNIDRVFQSAFIFLTVNLLLISTLVFFKDIQIYLMAQIVLYFLGALFIRRRMKKPV